MSISGLLFILALGGIVALMLVQCLRELSAHASGAAVEPGPWTTTIGAALSLTVGIGCVLFGLAEPGPLRFSVEALRVQQEVREVGTVGGDRQIDELVVKGAPAGLVAFARQDDGSVLVSSRTVPRESTPVIVLAGDRLLGGIEVQDGDRFKYRDCETQEPRTLTYSANGRRLNAPATEADAIGPSISREVKGFGFGRPLTARRHDAFSIRDYAPRRSSITCNPDIQSIFFHRPGGGLDWGQLDGEIEPQIKASANGQGGYAVKLCHAGRDCVRSVKIRIVEVVANDNRAAPAGWAEMRSFSASIRQDGRLELLLDTPKTVSFRRPDLDNEVRRLSQKAGPFEAIQLVSASAPPALLSDTLSNVEVDALGGDYSNFSYTLEFEARPFKLHQRGAPGSVENGGTVLLGEKQQVVARITSYDNTWPVRFGALSVLAAGALAAFAATWRARRESSAALAIFTLLDILLVMRVLVAIEAAVFDRGADAQAAPAQALAVFLMGPLALSLFCRSTYSTPSRLMAHAAVVLSGTFYIDRTIGNLFVDQAGGRFGALAIPIFALCATAIAAAAYGLLANAMGQRKWTLGDGIGHKIEAVRRWRPAASEVVTGSGNLNLLQRFKLPKLKNLTPDNRLATWAAFVGLLAIARLGLGAFGIQERVGPFLLSIAYVPACLILCAWFFAAWEDWRTTQPVWSIVAFGIAVLTLYFVVVRQVNDNGAVIFVLPVLLAAWFVALRREQEPRPVGLMRQARSAARFVLVIPLLAVVALLGWLNASSHVDDSIEAKLKSPETARAALDVPDLWTRNTLRVFAISDPEAVAEGGTRITEEIGETMANIDEHTKEMIGPGYLRSPAPVGLLRYHMNDNVSAVHLIGPFGRVGALMFALVLVAATILAVTGRSRDARDGFGLYLGALAMATIACVSAYMIMANTLSAPLTGRNVYMLSVASIGDFAECMMLLGLSLLMLSKPQLSTGPNALREAA